MDEQLRTLRSIHLAILASFVLYIWMGEFLTRESTKEISREIYSALAIGGAGLVGAALAVRQMMVGRAFAMLQTQPNDALAMARWRTGYIIIFAACEAVVLFGFLARFMGATAVEAAPFYAAGIFLLLLFYPRKP